MRAGAASRFRARAWAPQAEFDESWDSLGRHGVGSEPLLAELVRCCSQSSTSDARTGIGALQMDDAGPGTATLDDLIFVEPTLVSGADALGSIGPPHVEVSPLRIGAIVAEPSDADPDWPELHGPDELPFSCLLRNVNCFKPERKAPTSSQMCGGWWSDPIFTDPNIGSLGICNVPGENSGDDSGDCLPSGASCSVTDDQCCGYCHVGHCH